MVDSIMTCLWMAVIVGASAYGGYTIATYRENKRRIDGLNRLDEWGNERWWSQYEGYYSKATQEWADKHLAYKQGWLDGNACRVPEDGKDVTP